MQPLTVVEGINNRDPEAQTWVYETFFTRILNTVKRITHGSPDSHDITSDVFVIIMTHTEPFESVPKIYEFAYSIAEKKSINHNKKQNKIENHAGSLINHFENIEEKNRKNAETDDQYNHMMYLASETLPRQCKQVFQLHYIYRLKNAQIAKKLGITKRTVETHMTKAYQILRIEVKKNGKRYIFSITLIL
jgi:RNA polymerase sigma-70 factor (ECF subfamily)